MQQMEYQADDRMTLEAMGVDFTDSLAKVYRDYTQARRSLGITGPTPGEALALMVAFAGAIPTPPEVVSPFSEVEIGTTVFWRQGATVYSGQFRGVLEPPMSHFVRVWPMGDPTLEQNVMASSVSFSNPMVAQPALVDALRDDRGARQTTQVDVDKKVEESQPAVESGAFATVHTPPVATGSRVLVAIPGMDLFRGTIIGSSVNGRLSVRSDDGREFVCNAGDVVPDAQG